MNKYPTAYVPQLAQYLPRINQRITIRIEEISTENFEIVRMRHKVPEAVEIWYREYTGYEYEVVVWTENRLCRLISPDYSDDQRGTDIHNLILTRLTSILSMKSSTATMRLSVRKVDI